VIYAAFFISVAALLVAGASAYYTHRQSVATEQQAAATEHLRQIDAERRHDERTPTLDVNRLPPVRSDPQGRERIEVVQTAGPQLVGITASIVTDDPDPVPLVGLDFGDGAFVRAGALGTSEPGQRKVLRGQRDPSVTGGTLRLRLTATAADGSQWTIPATIAIPRPARVSSARGRIPPVGPSGSGVFH
jgi:hypothetical protein